jgi:nucleotide-binding universal stress UspA family protein
MSFKTILVHVEASPESDLRLGAAVRLANAWGASLIGLGGCEPALMAMPWASAYSDGEILQQVMDEEGVELKDAAVRFGIATESLRARAVWTTYGEYPAQALDSCAAGADLIVASAHRGPKASTAAAGDLVMRAGIPVLTIPTDAPSIAMKTIVIAWSNTPEARRAVSSSLPLLKSAERVTVLHVWQPNEDVATVGLEDVIGRLKRHGVDAAAESLPSLHHDVADSVSRFAEQGLFDLIVSGAYGHSHLSEWVLGGPTEGLLARSSLPVLFSH